MWYLKYYFKKFIYLLFCVFPIKKNKIVFDNFGGKGFGDNPKYLALELLRRNVSLDLVWISNNDCDDFPMGIRVVRNKTIRSIFEIMTAKIKIDNIKVGVNVIKRKGQICFQTWHGDFALKYIEGECEDFLDINYLKNSKLDSENTDFIISGNTAISNTYRTHFWYPPSCEVLEFGMPRNDIYFKFNQNEISELKKKYVNMENAKIVLYAPTFRDDKRIDAYNIDVNRLYELLKKVDSTINWFILVRLHPSISSLSNLFKYNDHILDGSCFSDPQELFLVSDVLVTDYSSLMGDFIIMKKPVFLYVPDLEEYVSKCRNLKPIFYKLPFPYCKNNDELINAIASFDNNDYQIRLADFVKTEYQYFDDGHASERVADWILNKI